MEFCRLGSAHDLMQRRDAPFAEAEIAWVVTGVARALEYMHSSRKAIHRDIKAGPHAERTRASVARQLARPPGAAPAPMGDQAWA